MYTTYQCWALGNGKVYTIREITDLVGNPEAHPAVIFISPAISVSIYLADFFFTGANGLQNLRSVYTICFRIGTMVLAVGLKHGPLI